VARVRTVTITKRVNKWEASYSFNGRQRYSFDDEGAAIIWAKQAEADMAKGLAPKPPEGHQPGKGQWTLQQAVDHAAQSHWNGKAPTETKMVLRALGAATKVASIDVLMAERGLRELQLQLGNSPNTTNRRLSALRVVLKEAYRAGVISSVPLLKAKEIANERSFRISPALEAEMLTWAVAKDTAFYDFLVLSLYGGQRASRTLHIRLGQSSASTADGYVEDEHLCFPKSLTRNKHVRTTAVPFRPIIEEVINRHAATKGATDRIFETRTYKWAYETWVKMKADLIDHPDVIAQKRDGEPLGQDFTVHILRHEFCSRLGDEGYSVAEIMDYSGHKLISQCDRYVKPQRVARRAKLARQAGALPIGLPGGEVPDYAPTRPVVRLVQKAPTPTIDTSALSADALAILEALKAAGLGDVANTITAAVAAKKA